MVGDVGGAPGFLAAIAKMMSGLLRRFLPLPYRLMSRLPGGATALRWLGRRGRGRDARALGGSPYGEADRGGRTRAKAVARATRSRRVRLRDNPTSIGCAAAARVCKGKTMTKCSVEEGSPARG